MTMTTTRRGRTDEIAEILNLVRDGFKDVAARLAETDRKAERAAQTAKDAVALARGTGDVDDEAAEASGLGRKRPTSEVSRKGKAAEPRAFPSRSDEIARLKDEFAALLSERPYYTAELAEIAGVPVAKAVNAIMLMERAGARLYRLGKPQRQVWWIADEESVTFLRAHPRSTWFK